MKRTDRWVAALATAVVCFGSVDESRAELINRGTYDGVILVYDTVQRITWLGDAGWAKTSGFDPDGEMTWGEARTWAGRLTIGGFSDWRLPITSDETCKGAGCTNSEMGHLFDVDGVSSANPVLFANVQEREYWSSRSDSSDPDLGWYVHFGDGDQGVTGKSDSFIPWAVRDGDVGAEVSIDKPGGLLVKLSPGSQRSTPVTVLASVLMKNDDTGGNNLAAARVATGDKAAGRRGAGPDHPETLCAYNDASWDCELRCRQLHRSCDNMIRRFR